MRRCFLLHEYDIRTGEATRFRGVLGIETPMATPEGDTAETARWTWDYCLASEYPHLPQQADPWWPIIMSLITLGALLVADAPEQLVARDNGITLGVEEVSSDEINQDASLSVATALLVFAYDLLVRR